MASEVLMPAEMLLLNAAPAKRVVVGEKQR